MSPSYSQFGRSRSRGAQMQLEEFESLIADYVAGALEEPELSRFEEALLGNPSWAQWVEAEQLLRSGVRELARVEPEVFAPPKADPKIAEFPRRPRKSAATWLTGGWALAATIGGAALLWNAQTRIDQLQLDLNQAQAPVGDVRVLRLDDMRGLDPARPQLDLTGAAGRVLLELPQGPQALPAYRVRLLLNERVVADINPALAGSDGLVLVNLAANRMTPGSYQAVVTAADSDTPTLGSYAFDVASH